MTRFWITENQKWILFKQFQRMIGGEIFIPIMPSIKITDLANLWKYQNKDYWY